MTKLQQLQNLCNNSINIYINLHRDYYEDVISYLAPKVSSKLPELIKKDLEISDEVFLKMLQTNTIVEINIYPDNSVGSYDIFHYDIEQALDEALSIIENKRRVKLPNR